MSDPADVRAHEVESQMTDDERFSLLVGVMGAGELWPLRDERIPPGVPMSAGYVPGIPRLGVPALLMSDAGLGVTNPGYRAGDTATALPSGQALAASFNPSLARMSGDMIGREARSRGFNVQLAGAINLARPYVDGPVLIIFVDTLFDADLSVVKRTDADGILSGARPDRLSVTSGMKKIAIAASLIQCRRSRVSPHSPTRIDPTVVHTDS